MSVEFGDLALPETFDWANVRAELELWAFRLTNGQMFVPPGTIVEYGGSTPPDGWVEADGEEYENTKFPSLFAAIGTTFGGTASTFNVPDASATPPTVGTIWIIKV